MMNYRLQSQQDSVEIISYLFGQPEQGESNKGLASSIEVCEDVCFAGKWLEIGNIILYPGQPEPTDTNPYHPVRLAITLGSYAWKIPALGDLLQDALDLMVASPDQEGKEKEKIKDKTLRALEGIVCAAARCGLIHPLFDADSLTDMPFRRATTVVADTSSVLHGALDFVVRFLYPMARVKIPAIVHMEILNLADRYLIQRRSKKNNKGSVLFDHVNSQGGQRVLLRLELQTDAEIERPRLGADPLRGIFDTDREHQNLNLHIVQRSFADRLILETAIHHRERLSPDHPIVLLTADQGLARMTLGEGMQPLFFYKDHSLEYFGSTLSGTSFRPFWDSYRSERLYYTSLTELLWEFAVTFGSARLNHKQSGATFEVCALGGENTWNPYHAKDDLLWVRWDKISFPVDQELNPTEECSIKYEIKPEAGDIRSPKKKAKSDAKRQAGEKVLKGSYRFSLPTMLTLIGTFHSKTTLSDEQGMLLLNFTHLSHYSKYKNFLLAGGFIKYKEDYCEKTEYLDKLFESINQLDYARVNELLLRVMSFAAFIESLSINIGVTTETNTVVTPSVFPTYRALSEICCAGLLIYNEGLYATPSDPPLDEFAKKAVQAYNSLSKGEKYILTGSWLEALARVYGIHPVKAKERLSEAQHAGYLERYTEGSTPETQYEGHVMNYLTREKGEPVIQRINLYHGDFLIPERSSVSIRIEGKL